MSEKVYRNKIIDWSKCAMPLSRSSIKLYKPFKFQEKLMKATKSKMVMRGLNLMRSLI